MNPIFSEYCKFLKDKVNLELEERYYWLDNRIIKAFDKQGNIHKLYRIVIDNKDLSVSYKVPKGYAKVEDIDIATWNEVVEMNKDHLEQIESGSKQLIIDKMDKFKGYIPLVPVSMGKDSQVTCHLVRECSPDTKAIFNNTTLDCADTYLMAKKFPNCEFMNPKQGFYQYIYQYNVIPSRFNRYCCRIFKTGEMVKRLDHNTSYLMFLGMRNEESNTRSGYGDEVVNPEWGNTKWQGILPIRTWSELDVWLYTFWRNIEINPKYKKGYSRCGCAIACPFSGKSTWVLDRYWYPTMRDRWEKILKDDFINNKKWITLNCTLEEYINEAWNGGVFRPEPTQEVISEYAKYNEISEDVAKQYFNKYCDNGCKSKSGKLKKIKDKEVLSMNLKLHGRNTNKFYCKKCLMNMYDMDDQKWNKNVEQFKAQGCALF